MIFAFNWICSLLRSRSLRWYAIFCLIWRPRFWNINGLYVIFWLKPQTCLCCQYMCYFCWIYLVTTTLPLNVIYIYWKWISIRCVMFIFHKAADTMEKMSFAKKCHRDGVIHFELVILCIAGENNGSENRHLCGKRHWQVDKRYHLVSVHKALLLHHFKKMRWIAALFSHWFPTNWIQRRVSSIIDSMLNRLNKS